MYCQSLLTLSNDNLRAARLNHRAASIYVDTCNIFINYVLQSLRVFLHIYLSYCQSKATLRFRVIITHALLIKFSGKAAQPRQFELQNSKFSRSAVKIAKNY